MRIFVLPFFLITVMTVYGQETFAPPQTAAEVLVGRAIRTIKIDGKLNEADWENAVITDDFFRREPRQGGDYKYKTEVRFLYDNKNLYVGTFCSDSIGIKGIRVQDLRRDFTWGENDIIGIALDPQNLKQYAVGFQTTPYGNQRDFQNFNGDSFDIGWNTLWRVRTHKTATGYYAEFAIPFKSLRYDLPEKGKAISWGMTLVRYARRDIEETTFPAIPQSFTPYRMTYAAKLIGIELPPPAANIRVEPYALYQYDESKSGNGTLDSSNDLKMGVDVKWAITPKAVVDLTVNTDFAQADVDRAVNNLERFNIFFPEQRQFFLENSGIWAGANNSSITPFFSRRIGLQGEFNATPAPIDVGARYTERNEKRTIAGLYVHQREADNAQAANFSVFRYQQNYGKENNVGVMLTHRLDEKSNALGLENSNNTTITIDGLVRPKSEWGISYLASVATDEVTGDTGYAARLAVNNNSNKFSFEWLTEFIDEKYNPRIGFVRQNNIVSHNPGGFYIWRPKKADWIRQWDPGVFVNYNHDATGTLEFQQASLYIFPVFTWFKDNSFIELSTTPTWQNINFNFAPLGLQIEQGRYFYNRYRFRYRTDRSKKWSASIGADFGKFYDGQRNTYTAGIRYAPIPHIALTGDYEHNNLNSIGINSQDLETDLYTASLRLALNPRAQLSTFYQFNSFDDQGRWNVRLGWEYSPLSFIYLVFNDSQINSLEPVINNRQFITKITYLKQF